MKKLLLATAAVAALLSSPVLADGHGPIKIGVLLSFTGPIESLTPGMGGSAELAMKEVSESGKLLGGKQVESVRADGTCIDSAAATAAAERLVTSDKVSVIMGADCSGITGAVLQNVARPNGIVMVSPSATSPALTTAEDDGLFFRTAPSDARQGEVLAEIMMEKGVKSAALTYTNNDYGKGLADAIQASFEKLGGKVTISAAHEDGKGDYSAEVAALAQAGGDALIVAGYLDQGGKGVIQGALDSGAFDMFVLPDGMIGDSLPDAIGADLNGSFGTKPGAESKGNEIFNAMADEAGIKSDAYSAESYDAAALLMLAMQAANSSKSADVKGKIMDVANAPGEKILPGELGKALEILAAGGEIDYVGASAVELIGAGESAGTYQEILIADEKVTVTNFR